MPEEILEVSGLFSGQKQYKIPLYQRRYVWDTMNWDALWRDLTQLQGKKHFTGTIVTKPYDEWNSSPTKKDEIIDGQQRLTTFQIIFCVIRDLCASGVHNTSTSNQIESTADGFTKLNLLEMEEPEIVDDVTSGTDEGFSPYRLLLTKERDREAFHLVVSGKFQSQIKEASDIIAVFQSLAESEQSDQNLIVKAYGYFGTKIAEYLQEKGADKLRSLTRSLSYDFYVMSAKVGVKDDPQQIFGSINGTGRALDEFDLLRNDLFLRIENREQQEVLYQEYWCYFDEEPFWEQTGRTDEFLRYFLTAKLGLMNLSRERLFHDIYKGDYHKKLRTELQIDNENELKFVKTEFQELAKYAKSYQEMEDPTTIIGRRRQFYNDLNLVFENLNLTSLPPFILAVENELGLNSDERNQVYQILESYILRCQLAHGVNEDKTTSLRINALFSCLDLFSCLIKNDDKDIEKFDVALTRRLFNGNVSVETWIDIDRVVAGLRKVGDQITNGEKFSVALAGLLSSGNVPGRMWLDNKQVLAGLRRIGHQIENGSSSARRPVWNMLRYIFYRIECLKRENSPTDSKEDKLGFNHFFTRSVLIQPIAKSPNLKTAYSIGNLTFCEKALPIDFSFLERKEILLQMPNALLLLNKEMKDYPTWGVKQILQEREKSLLACFYKIWPPAEDFTETVTGSKAEPRWISAVQLNELQPIRFVTYSRVEELSEIRILGDKVIGFDDNNNQQTLEKRNILFACSMEAWPEVGPYVEILGYVRREHLQSPRNRDELFYVPDRLLTSAQEEQGTVIPVTRYGHVFQGTTEGFDKDAIYMQIREHTVIVYRDGLHEFAIEEWHQGVVTEFDENSHFGFIQSGNLPRIFVHINDVLDKTIMSLQVDQRVEFDINRSIKGLSAINVNLSEE